MSGPPIRLAISGCGRIAGAGYLPALRGVEAFELAAVADPDEGRSRALADAAAAATGLRPAVHASVAEMLSATEPGLLLVASPPSEHLHDAELASEAGVSCLVEKPPAADATDAMRMAALESPPWIGFNRRFQHGACIVGSLPRGEFDVFCEIRYRRRSWAPFAVRDDALLDLGPHLVDLALFLTCSPSATVLEASSTADRFELVLETRRGRATVRGATDRAYFERVAIHDRGGARFAASVSGGRARLLAGRLPGTEIALVSSLRDQLSEVAAALRGEPSELLATAEDGARVMRVIGSARAVAGDPARALEYASGAGVAGPA